MTKGIHTTILTLTQSKNKAVIPLLEKALDSSSNAVRKAAGNQLIALNGAKGVLKLISKFDPADETLVDLFNSNRERVFPALRTAISGNDPQLARNAFRIVYTQRFFEILPSMLNAFLNQDKTEAENASLSEGILKLVAKYVQALEERKNRRRLQKTVLSEIVGVLANGLRDFHRNDPDLFLIVFLQLAVFLTEKHSVLTKLLYNPSSALHAVIRRLLFTGKEPYLFRFVVHCLDNPNPPPIALTVFSKRFDIPFISYFLKNLEEPVSVSLKTNLAGLQQIEWLVAFHDLLEQLDEQAQSGLVILVQNLGFPDNEVQAKLLDLFHDGNGKSRVAALAALARFPGEQMDQLVWDACGDTDPNVQAAALSLLGRRNITNANFRILQFANSSHQIVQETIQKLLPDFRLPRFFEMFDQLTEEQRRSMFHVVKVLDPQIVSELSQILVIGEPREKAKALICIGYGGMVLPLEDSLCGVLAKGEMPAIRNKAAELLAAGQRELSRSTLVQAFHRDPDPTVRATAKNSLEKRPAYWEKSVVSSQ
ncbi:MAG: hypothetical protein LBQ50_06490 [Planctomycetaceae bacterium]|jgi:HEAT repeat protein|nr:hypothetical protein [Planctomycetaceae bacterium]